MSDDVPTVVQRFANLFHGLEKAHGKWANDRAKTVRNPPVMADYEAHISGRVGLGIIPVNLAGKCHFGGIDIDTKNDSTVTVNHGELAQRIAELEFPLIVCRSKSGGAHLYTFNAKGVPARTLRRKLSRWAVILGYGGQEIFPKQDVIDDVGNWINLPYFNATNTDRMAFSPITGKPIGLDDFLTLAEAMSKESDNDFTVSEVLGTGGTDEAPPCIAAFYKNKAPMGVRNDMLFNFGVYLKRAFPDNWEDKLYEANYQAMEKPLPMEEVKRAIQSLKKKEYWYKCDHPAVKRYCDRFACQSSKHGISSGDEGESGYDPMILGRLAKVLTEPPHWLLDVNGIDIMLDTADLMNYSMVRLRCLEQVSIVVPPMKGEDWVREVKRKVTNMVTIHAPEDASLHGQLSYILSEFLQLADRTTSKEDIMRGLPVKASVTIQAHEHSSDAGSKFTVPATLFRSSDFVNYLRRKNVSTQPVSASKLWLALRDLGCGYTKVKIGGRPKRVWYVPDDTAEVDTGEAEPLAPKTEEGLE